MKGMSHFEIEEGSVPTIDWEKLRAVAAGPEAVIPAVAQDVKTGAVVMVGYANAKALHEAMARKCAVFWSTSRNELWIKGGTSGQVLELIEVRVNCEQNSLLYRVRLPEGGGACHTADEEGPRYGCYYRIWGDTNTLRPALDRGRVEAEVRASPAE